MTILVDWQIKDYINKGVIKIDPFDESLVNPTSLDIRLGDTFGKIVSRLDVIDPLDKSSFSTEYWQADSVILNPSDCILASMLENVYIDDTICCELRGKSSLGRLGIINSDGFAGWVDSGWQGNLTMEIVNLSSHKIKLTSSMKIGQITFYESEPPEKSYKLTGRYLNQNKGQGSLGVAG